MGFIDIENLCYTYPGESRTALSNISLHIERGEIILVTGESGSGKSTLAKCITGAVPNFYGGTVSGSIRISGKSSREIDDRERARDITMVFQDPESQLVMNQVHREVAFGLQNVGTEESRIKRRVWEALEFTNIADIAYRDVGTLSGGQKQKVAIASALAYLPQCIIFDEPTSQLDPSSAQEIVMLARKINEELGITVIVIEQRINRWFGIVDRVAVMRNGAAVFIGSPWEMYGEPGEYIESFLPTGLKLSRGLGISEMPDGFKGIRKSISGFDFSGEYGRIRGGAPDEEAIEIKNVCCRYGDEKAVKNVSVTVNSGDFLGVLGSNGAGKSTLLKSIIGLVKYTGSIRVFGTEVSRMKIRELAGICGYVSQNPNDYLSKDSVYDELKFTLDNFGVKDDGIIGHTLELLDIGGLRNKNPRDLSGGEKQRVAIASVLVMKPRILLIDEPTRGLDMKAKERLAELLLGLNGRGTTILLVTHDTEFASGCCTRFMLMFDGEMVSYGAREEVLGGGIYYTTDINKLVRDKNDSIFTLSEALRSAGRAVH